MTDEVAIYIKMIEDQIFLLLENKFSGNINITLVCNNGGIRSGKIGTEKVLKK